MEKYYFTSFPQYAMPYALESGNKDVALIKAPDVYTLIVAFVNCGNTLEIEELHYGKEIPASCYGYHVRVKPDGTPLTTDEEPTYQGLIYDEYCIKDTTRILPQYAITLHRVQPEIFVWRDPNIENPENSQLLEKLKQKECRVYSAKSTEQALKVLRKKQEHHGDKLRVITCGSDDGDKYVANIRGDLNLDCPILVFCRAVSYHETWAKKFQNIFVTDRHEHVLKFLENPLEMILSESNPKESDSEEVQDFGTEDLPGSDSEEFPEWMDG